jgi:hypothetical protein
VFYRELKTSILLLDGRSGRLRAARKDGVTYWSSMAGRTVTQSDTRLRFRRFRTRAAYPLLAASCSSLVRIRPSIVHFLVCRCPTLASVIRKTDLSRRASFALLGPAYLDLDLRVHASSFSYTFQCYMQVNLAILMTAMAGLAWAHRYRVILDGHARSFTKLADSKSGHQLITISVLFRYPHVR